MKTIVNMYGNTDYKMENGMLVTLFNNKWQVLNTNGVIVSTPIFTTSQDAINYVTRQFNTK